MPNLNGIILLMIQGSNDSNQIYKLIVRFQIDCSWLELKLEQ